MARKALIAKQKRREKTVLKYAEKRKELKEKGDYEALQKLPRDSNASRLINRCNDKSQKLIKSGKKNCRYALFKFQAGNQ